jgi:pyruvate dehydrogenase phosphatase
VSRSIGDVYLKKPEFNRDPIFQQFGNPIPLKRPVMTAEPSILVRKLKPQDLFLIFASDGLWEQLTDEAAVDIVFKNPRAVSAHLSLIFYNFFSTVINILLSSLMDLV